MNFARIVKLSAPSLILCAAATGLCFAAAGNSLGFYLGPIALVSLILPPLAGVAKDRTHALIITAGAVDGVGIVWLLVALASQTTLWQWLQCYLLLAGYALALCGLVRLTRMASLVTVLALAWLTWPVWLSPRMTPDLVAWLAPAQPMLAINRAMLDLGVWTQQRLMYQFTTLGQDVAYALPRSAWPAVLLHALIGVTALWLARWPVRTEPPTTQTEPRTEPPPESPPAPSSRSASAAGA